MSQGCQQAGHKWACRPPESSLHSQKTAHTADPSSSGKSSDRSLVPTNARLSSVILCSRAQGAVRTPRRGERGPQRGPLSQRLCTPIGEFSNAMDGATSAMSLRWDGRKLDEILVEELLAAELAKVELDLLHPLQQGVQVGFVLHLDADQRGAAFLVRLFDVLEADDVVRRTEGVVDELAQLARLLGELDDEVVLAPQVDEAALEDFGVA